MKCCVNVDNDLNGRAFKSCNNSHSFRLRRDVVRFRYQYLYITKTKLSDTKKIQHNFKTLKKF